MRARRSRGRAHCPPVRSATPLSPAASPCSAGVIRIKPQLSRRRCSPGKSRRRRSEASPEPWAVKDPSAAAAWADQLTDSSARANAFSNVASVWARQDPAAAVAWASQEPETSHALSTITREWAAQDSTAAAKWLDTLPSGDTRDSTVASFSQAVADADPEGAAVWAATISKPQQRENAISSVFRQWKRTDPKTAEAWLHATPALSKEAKERMFKQEN
jgi:hypothetical protein